MRTVLELALPRELRCKEADGAHGRRELVDMVLSEVSSEYRSVRGPCSQRTWANIRSRPLRVTCPDSGSSSPIRSLINVDLPAKGLRYVIASSQLVHAPAPFAPTTAIRESNPTSMFAFFRRILFGLYPNVTSFSCKRGGDIFSVSGNLCIRQTNPQKARVERSILEALCVLCLGRFQIGEFL